MLVGNPQDRELLKGMLHLAFRCGRESVNTPHAASDFDEALVSGLEVQFEPTPDKLQKDPYLKELIARLRKVRIQ